MPCRGDFQPAPIRRLEALCTARRGTRMSLNRFQGASRGQPLKRRVDAAYLQPYGFRFQVSRFLPAEHRCLLRRLATWQLLRRASSTFSDARRSGTAWREAGTACGACQRLFSRIIFLGCEFFLAEKMNSDGIVFGGKRMRENKALFLELILRIAN
jgi:hypothetical protein